MRFPQAERTSTFQRWTTRPQRSPAVVVYTVRKHVFLRHFWYKYDHFTEPRSGQSQGKLKKEMFTLKVGTMSATGSRPGRPEVKKRHFCAV
jgi:hypothetical protein|eukprot:COSAG06_NODE_2438_length_6875_cov_7.162633_10_plen_91_part_00